MAASPTRAALMPIPTSQRIVRSTGTNSSKKRKRAEVDSSTPRDGTFTATALATSLKPQAAAFTPITTVARGVLPLSWLDPLGPEANIPPGYLFKTEACILQENEQALLFARLRPNGGLYAIEKVEDEAYTAWPLLNWVSEELCHNAASGSTSTPELQLLIQSRCGHSRTGSISSEPPAPQPTPCSPKKAKNRRGALARVSILTPKDSMEKGSPADILTPKQPLLASPQGIHPDSSSSALPLELAVTFERISPQSDEPSHAQPPMTSLADSPRAPGTEASILSLAPPAVRQDYLDSDQLRQQYLDILYFSKASLAFYAKGPLSRARAQAKAPELRFGLEALQECYLAMILPVKKIDLKYKDSISNIVQNVSAATTEGGREAKSAKRKNSKKPRVGKDGLYTGEDDLITGWWRSREIGRPVTTSVDVLTDELRIAILELRSRETEMQLLLLLEVLYIETLTLKAARTTTHASSPEIKVESLENDAAALSVVPTRSKKKRDLNGELDAAAERLCIWHTVALEDMFASPEKAREGSDGSATKSKDKLRDFCRDVIIPFYSVKLPEESKSLCRKLGGPEISPQRPRSHSSKSIAHPPARATAKSKPRPALKRPLERVLSEDQSVRHASPPVLSRSSTAPLISKLKREPSETDTRPMSRSGMPKSVSFTNREIDLVADAKAHATKRQKLEKLATQKKELEAAIDALKKPNRTNAAKAFMDEIERRNVDSKTGTKRTDSQVHITATPRRVKPKSSSHDVFTQSRSQIPMIEAPDPNPVIPASTVKPTTSQPNLSVPPSSRKKRAVLSAIHDTPSRGLSKLSTPLAVVEATPATNRLRPDLPIDTPLPARHTTKSGKPILFTPLKRRDVSDTDVFLFRDVPEIPEKAGKAMDRVMGGKGVAASFDSIPTSTSKDDYQARETAGGGGTAVETGNVGMQRSIYEELGWDEYDVI